MKYNTDGCAVTEYIHTTTTLDRMYKCPLRTTNRISRYQFTIVSYIFICKFVLVSKTSFPITGLISIRNHHAVLDTLNLPDVEVTMSMTGEMKKCDPKRIQIRAAGNQTKHPQHSKTVNTPVITNSLNAIAGQSKHYPNTAKQQRSISPRH